ncbi:MAG: hypothetical protein NVS9B7_02690 [Flavisolibacter sp.]
MRLFIYGTFLCLGISLAPACFAQQFGAFPPRLRWQQIDTDTARIIFQHSVEKQAQRIASLVHKAAADTSEYKGSGLQKINIVLHNQTTLANGYVGLAPFRSEYYLVPPSDVFEFGNLPWYENLAFHEYRHVQQYNYFKNGLSKTIYQIFGEEGLALANAVAVPNWFYEGDAVHTETALTTQGRGRLSSFLSSFNSLWQEDKNYSWMKLRNGSLKDYVPDHYRLGYLLVNYGYLKYGPDLWKNVTYDATAFKGLFYPFQKAIKKYTGLSFRKFREQGLDYYKSKIPYKDSIHRGSKTVTSVYFAQYISADSIIYLKTAFNKKPSFYVLDQRGEHKLAGQNINSEQWLSYRNHKLVYTGYSVKARWGLMDYNDIVITDLADKRTTRLTHKEKYFSPDLSLDGKKIVAIHINDSLQTELRILNSLNGRVVQIIKPAPGLYLTQPKFLDENRVVVGTKNESAMMTFQEVDLTSGTWVALLPYSEHTLGQPFINKNNIYFTANFNGNDDIYLLQGMGKKLFQLTNGLTGNYFPSVFNDTLLWSGFTAEGLALHKKALNQIRVTEINNLTLNERVELYPVAFAHDLSGLPTRSFRVKSYPKSTGLVHFHSLSPYYSDPELTLSLYSDNILNTFTNEIYYRYNQNESSHTAGFNTSYGALFPVLKAGASYIYNRTINTSTRVFTLNQIEFTCGYEIPLNFTKGTSYKLLLFGTKYAFNRSIPTGIYKDSDPIKDITYIHNFINWAHYAQTAVQQIYPKLGYAFSINDRRRIGYNDYQLLANAQFFLPSIANHSVVLSASFQQTDTNNVVFVNRFTLPRGYPGYYFSRMWRASANYHFPICYPDIGWAQIVYIQRLRGNLFYDYGRVYSKNKLRSLELRSTGGELFFDTKWWNELPVSFGVRLSFVLDYQSIKTNQTYLEIILPVNLIPKR